MPVKVAPRCNRLRVFRLGLLRERVCRFAEDGRADIEEAGGAQPIER